MFPSEIGKKPPGGVPFAIIFGGTVLLPDEFRADRHHLRAVRGNKGPGDHLQVVLDGAVAPLPGQAVVGADMLRTVDPGSVDGQQQVTVQAGHLRQHLAPLQLMKDTAESRPELGRRDFIENCAHLGVAGDHPHAVDTVQTFRPLRPPLVKGEQGGILERKHGKGAHQRIGQRNRSVGSAMIEYLAKILADGGEQGIGVEMSAHFDGAHCLA